MIKHTLQEWVDFTGLYGAKDSDERVFLYDKKPTRRKNIWQFAGECKDITTWVSAIDEINDRKLYSPTPVLQKGDRVLCWNPDWDKDTFPEIGYYLEYREGTFIMTNKLNAIRGSDYEYCIPFDKDLTGLTIGELECRLGAQTTGG